MQKDSSHLFLIPDAKDLDEYEACLTAASQAVEDDNLVFAELLFKLTIQFCEDAWGPYTCFEARVLVSLADLYSQSGRYEEAEITRLLAIKIFRGTYPIIQ